MHRRVELTARRLTAFPVITQVLLCAGAVFVYFRVRGLTESRPHIAFQNADLVLRLERELRINWEYSLQQQVIGSRLVTNVLNWIYIYGHWPVIVVTLIWLLTRHPDVFRRTRNAMFLSGAIGMVVFATFPVAPPRLDDVGLVDTISEQSRAYRVLQPTAFTNQYAAMPSLHVGWDLLIGLAIWTAGRRLWLRLLGLAMPIAMTFAVVLTANHYLLDVLVGAGLTTTAWLAVQHIRIRRRPRHRQSAVGKPEIKRAETLGSGARSKPIAPNPSSIVETASATTDGRNRHRPARRSKPRPWWYIVGRNNAADVSPANAEQARSNLDAERGLDLDGPGGNGVHPAPAAGVLPLAGPARAASLDDREVRALPDQVARDLGQRP
jgi:membrane-associated phospholipid phosphatase